MTAQMGRKRDDAAELARLQKLLSESEALGRRLRQMAAVLSDFTEQLTGDGEPVDG